MTYKDKKLKEFEDNHKSTWDIQEKGIVATVIDFDEAKDFLSSTIDEIMACLPDHTDENEVMILQGEDGKFFNHGFNCCILSFLQNLKAKAGEV